jgi:hypothetical protein
VAGTGSSEDAKAELSATGLPGVDISGVFSAEEGEGLLAAPTRSQSYLCIFQAVFWQLFEQ